MPAAGVTNSGLPPFCFLPLEEQSALYWHICPLFLHSPVARATRSVPGTWVPPSPCPAPAQCPHSGPKCQHQVPSAESAMYFENCPWENDLCLSTSTPRTKARSLHSAQGPSMKKGELQPGTLDPKTQTLPDSPPFTPRGCEGPSLLDHATLSGVHLRQRVCQGNMTPSPP